MLREMLRHELIKAASSFSCGIEVPYFNLKTPDNPSHGDYATNIAFVLARRLSRNPNEIAQDVTRLIRTNRRIGELTSRVEAAGGFINFWFSNNALEVALQEILKRGASYGKNRIPEKRQRINIEFISANPTGPLTVGNGRGAFLGETLSNVLQMAGRRVTREYYINDARASAQIHELGKAILKKGEAYSGPYTDEIRKRLKKKYLTLSSMDENVVGFLAAQEIQRDNKEFVEKNLKIKFDVWYSEETLYKKRFVEKTLATLMRRGLAYEKDGAVWFRASAFGDSEDRVALRSHGGAPTYFLPDVAYHHEKLTKRKFDQVIDILGADHHGTFPRVRAGLQALGDDPERVHAIFTQLVRIVRGGKEVKISKRRGSIVTLKALIDEVGADAARYFFLERSPETHMDFDLDLAKSRSMKNPVYYLQYAYVRCHSILQKTKNQKPKIKIKEGGLLKLLNTPEEQALIKKLIQFPEAIIDTAEDFAVIRLTRYGSELARNLHHFYETHRVITEDFALTAARLALVRATKIVLENLLRTMGISTPKKM